MTGAVGKIVTTVIGVLCLFGVAAAVWLIYDGSNAQAAYEQKAEAKAKGYADRASIARERRCAALTQPKKFECEQEENKTAREGAHNAL
jgi:hypothetical protein